MKFDLSGKNTSAFVVFPDQLFAEIPLSSKEMICILTEEPLYFTQYPFHKQKLIYHRASMQAYRDYLEQKGYRVYYLESHQPEADVRNLIPALVTKGILEIHHYALTDDWLERRMFQSAQRHKIQMESHSNPAFLLSRAEAVAYAPRGKKYFQSAFYQEQRKRFNILLDAEGKPEGGKWSFDEDNRKKLPKGIVPPEIQFAIQDIQIQKAKAYVEKHFGHHPGTLGTTCFAYDHAGAIKWLENFLRQRFLHFGTYEDAISTRYPYVYHSLLSPYLNTGLLTPAQVLDAALAFGKQHTIPLNSIEGFVRQILGWREFIRIVYMQQGRKQRTENHLQFKRKLPKGFWDGTTGIAPVDRVIHQVIETGYCHHIERLMILGNFLLLCETDPDEVYAWFMTFFIDAYDWVMVPNVYGMSQFSDGGLMTTKPYISGSNYIRKMSDEPVGEWQDIWDALFWRFMSVHRHLFESNPRMGMLIKQWDKKSPESRTAQIQLAEAWLLAH